MKNNKNDRIVLERDTSLPKERFSQIKQLKNLEIQKSSKKLSNSQSKSKIKSLNNENQLDNNINSNDNDNNSKKINKKSNTKSKEAQNACTQVNFYKEIMESEIKNTLLQYEEREKEMKLKIKDLLKTIQDIKSENLQIILSLKKNLNEKIQLVNNLKALNFAMKKQLEKEKNNTNNKNNKNNQIEIKKKKIKNNSLNKNNNKMEHIEINESINNKLNNRLNNINDEIINSKSIFISDYYSKKNGFKLCELNDINNQNNRYNNNDIINIIENDKKDNSIYEKKVPEIILNNSLNYQNKNKSNFILKDVYRNNKYKINKSKSNITRLKIERIEPNVFLKSISYNKRKEIINKNQIDYSLKVCNNKYLKNINNKEKRVLSAKLLNIKDFSNVDNSKFGKTFYKLKLN